MNFEQKPGGILTKAKKHIKGAIIGANMLMAATPALADSNALKKLTDEKPQEKTHIETITNKTQGNELDEKKFERIRNKHPDELTSEEFKYLIEHREQEQKESATERAETIREGLVKFFESQDFFEKLKVEYEGDEKKAREVQMEDINNLKTVEIFVLTNSDYYNEIKNLKLNTPSRFSVGCYDYSPKKEGGFEHRILINSNASGLESEIDDIIRHELTHAATKNKVSEKAAKILTESYQKLQDGQDLYNASPAERLARKQALDCDLEKLQIKKYEEEFTKKHYDEMMKAYDSETKILSPSSINFIKRTNPNFEDFKKDFDEIAQNGENKDNSATV